MKTECDRRQQIRTLSISLAGFLWVAFVAGAAQEPYDIDLKELKRPPVRRAKEQQPPPHKPKKSLSATTDSKREHSSYTVRPGDHLFLILMQRYGLSNEAAEHLIPEIMRLNGIRNPGSLSVGQRLTIPLPPATDKPLLDSRQESPRPTQPDSAAAQHRVADTTHVREVVVPPAKPCLLANEVAEQLGVRVSALSPLIDSESISVSNNSVKIAVVCGLAPAETYTLDRLLARHGVKLLAFKADEAPRTVIETLAGNLGISFRLSNADTAEELPLTYLFPAADLKLTIRSALPASK